MESFDFICFSVGKLVFYPIFVHQNIKTGGMGNFTKQRERRKRMEEGDKVRREKIGGYFLTLSQLVFVALVWVELVLYIPMKR